MSLQTFLDSCKNISEINNVIAEEPTDAMMAQITSNKYTFTEKPTLFRFNVTTDSKTKNINVIVPFEIWNNIQHAPIGDLLDLANRIDETETKCRLKDCVIYDENSIVYFIRPDTLRTYCLVGRSIDEIVSPEESINDLIGLLETIPEVSDSAAYNIVDTNLLTRANTNDAIMIVCSVAGSTEKTQTIVPVSVYSSSEEHINVYNEVKSNVEELLNN